MIVDIKKHEFSIIWDGIYYYTLSNYPNISKWELKKLILFLEYEKANGRTTEIECEDIKIKESIKDALNNKEKYLSEEPPDKITECTACTQKGCLTKFVCHTSSVENAISIFRMGKLLSAMESRKKTKEELSKESRNAAKDPLDYFNYVMLSWGNCQAGDRLVMERLLERAPNEDDLTTGFKPGIRFYFEYEGLRKHKNATFDGYHSIKIKDELELTDNLYAVTIPIEFKDDVEIYIQKNIRNKVIFVEGDYKNIWEWSEKVYEYVNSYKFIKK